uniref:Cilia and flagella associated protein 65 n=1 Tax=Sus scrofa TaxID=9823 RepID=A0A8D0P9N9_PIG
PMLIEAALDLLLRTGDSGDCTMNSGSCLTASTMAIPTITGSTAMSACSSSNASACPASSVDTKLCLLKKQEKMKKRVVWGIEVAEELQWKGWELGKEITKNLVLKNLSWKIQKIKYRYQYEGSETKPLSPKPPKKPLFKKQTVHLKCHIKPEQCIRHIHFE